MRWKQWLFLAPLPLVARGQFAGPQTAGAGLPGQLAGSALGDYAEAAPQLTGAGYQLPDYTAQNGVPLVHGAENLPPLVAPRVAERYEPGFTSVSEVDDYVRKMGLDSVDKTSAGLTSLPDPAQTSLIDPVKMSLPDSGKSDLVDAGMLNVGSSIQGATGSDFASMQAAVAPGVSAGAPASWQPEWQAPAQQLPPLEMQSQIPAAPALPPQQLPVLAEAAADWRAATPPSPQLPLTQAAATWQTQSLMQSPPIRLPSNRIALGQQEDASSLMHLRGTNLGDATWRQPDVPLPLAQMPAASPAIAAAPASAAAAAAAAVQQSKPFLLQVNPLSPVSFDRARVKETIVQVDELLCNPPCASGHGVCARDATGSAYALSGGAPRCFCRSPFSGPTCGTPDEPLPATWGGKVALLGTTVLHAMPDPLHRGPLYQAGILTLIAGALVVLLTMCVRALNCRRTERGPKCLSPVNLFTALRRPQSPAEHSPLLRAPQRNLIRAPEAQRTGHGYVEAWVKTQPRSNGSIGRRRQGLDSVPQVVKDESDEEN